jgi:hypothetical protein
MMGHKEVEIRAKGVERLAGVLAAIAVGGASLAIGPATALGGVASTQAGPLRYVSDTTSAPADDDGNAFVNCPTGFRVTGGGGRIGGPADQVRIGSIAPYDLLFDVDSFADDGYTAETFNASAATRTARSVAICLRNPKGGSSLLYNTGLGSMIAMGSSVGTGASATCASGRVVGGGLRIPGPATTQFEEQLNSSAPRDNDSDKVSDEGWAGKLNVNSSTVNRTPVAHAICLPGGVMKMRYRFTAKVIFPGVSTVRTSCPKRGWHVSGGGAQGFFSRIDASEPFDSGDKAKAPDDGWRATVQLSSGADPAALLVHAICLKPA